MRRRIRTILAVVLASLAVAFIALWIRSYWVMDSIIAYTGTDHAYAILSAYGKFETYRRPSLKEPRIFHTSYPVPEWKKDGPFAFEMINIVGYAGVRFPHWALVIFLAAGSLFLFRASYRSKCRGFPVSIKNNTNPASAAVGDDRPPDSPIHNPHPDPLQSK